MFVPASLRPLILPSISLYSVDPNLLKLSNLLISFLSSSKYRKENPNGISTNAKTVEFTDDKVTVTENLEIADTGAMVDTDGVPMDSLEIGITSINLKSNEVKTGKIYTKAKSPEDKS